MFAYIFASKYLHMIRRDVFQALVDPTRRALLSLIAVQAMTPTALADHFKMTRQAVSSHIQILNACDLLYMQKQGREYLYSLNASTLKVAADYLESFRKHWEDSFTRLDHVLNKLD